MFLKIKFYPDKMLDYLKTEIPEIGYIQNCVIEYTLQETDNIWDKFLKVLHLIGCVVKQTTALVAEEGWTVDRAIDVGSHAVDELIGLSGLLGNVVEGFDDALCKMLLKAGYELVRDRLHLSKKEFIQKAIEEVKKLGHHA